MPIKPRLDPTMYSRVSDLVDAANQFIFFGTYSIATEFGIVREIIDRKNAVPALHVSCLFPPPTDKILRTPVIRNALLGAYGLASVADHVLGEAVANNPVPAYQILDQLWNAGAVPHTRSIIESDIEAIGRLYQNGIPTLLEPNTHAKFIATEDNIYEGSANLTYYGMNINVEVFNFYPRRFPNVYNFAWRSYYHFLVDYLGRYIDWKVAAAYVTKARDLGQRISDTIGRLGIRFNPRVTREKYGLISKARQEIDLTRSDVWMLPGHKRVLQIDFMLNIASDMTSELVGMLTKFIEQEIDQATLDTVYKRLSVASAALGKAKDLLVYDPHDFQTSYENEFLDSTIKNATIFKEKLMQNHRPEERAG